MSKASGIMWLGSAAPYKWMLPLAQVSDVTRDWEGKELAPRKEKIRSEYPRVQVALQARSTLATSHEAVP